MVSREILYEKGFIFVSGETREGDGHAREDT